MDEVQRQAYLQAMGIQCWIPRSADAGQDAVETVVPAAVAFPAKASAVAPATDTSPPQPRVAVQPPQAAEDEPPPWLDEVPPPADEYLPALDRDGAGDPYAETGLPDNGVGRLDWKGLEARVTQCQACELHKTRTQTVFGIGRQDADLLIIGEAPGAEEDRKGEPFVGRAGQLLNAMLKAIGLRREQVYIANILKCRPPGNRDPRAEEALQCAPYLQRQVELVKPRVILAVGAVAARNLLHSDEAVGRLRGGQHDYQGVPVVVTYHPAYLLRSPEQKAKAWQDLQKAARLVQ